MREPEMTATMEAELRLLDEALEAGGVSSDDPAARELQELALALQAEAAEPSREFGRRLRRRVDEGFRRERRLPGLVLRRPRGKTAFAGIASALLAVAVAVSLVGRESERAPERQAVSADRPTAAPSVERFGGQAPAIAPGPPPPARPGFAPGERTRRIERSASMTLAAPADELDRTADAIARLTDRHEGFVLRSTLATGGDGTTGGDFELRIPADRLQAALAELSKLADVRSLTQSGQDVTREFASAEDRLEAARAERRSLLRRLERAPSDSAVEAIRRRLDLNAGEIRGLRGQVRDLRTRTNYAAVSVTLQDADREGGGSSPDSDEGLGGAVDDSLDSLGDSAELLVRALGLAIPLGLLAAGLALAARALRRRSREAALSG